MFCAFGMCAILWRHVLCHWSLCALMYAIVIGVCTPVWGHVPCLWGLHALLGTHAMALGVCALVGTCAVPSGCVCCYRDRCHAVGECMLLWEHVLCRQGVHSAIPTFLWECVPCHWCVCVLMGPCAMSVGAVSPPRQVVPKQPLCLPPVDVSLTGRKLINYQPPSQLLSRGTLERMGSVSWCAWGHR